jgi:hypothetical protein
MSAPVQQSSFAAASERVRSTVASIESMSSTRMVAMQAAVSLPAPAPVPQLGYAGGNDARGQLRYLHRRVSGAANNHSREMVR